MGAIEIPFFKWTLPAAGDLSAGQYLGLVMSGANTTTGGAGVRVIGIQQNKPAAAGRAVEIQTYGLSKVVFGATVAVGADVSIDAAGKFITSAGSAAILGSCIFGGDADEIGTVLLGTGVVADPRSHFLDFELFDVSNATSAFIICPVTGDIARVRTVVTAALTTAAGLVTLEIAAVLVVGSNVVLADAAAIGDADDSGAITPAASTAVVAGDVIEITSDGVPDTGSVSGVIEIVPS